MPKIHNSYKVDDRCRILTIQGAALMGVLARDGELHILTIEDEDPDEEDPTELEFHHIHLLVDGQAPQPHMKFLGVVWHLGVLTYVYRSK